MTTFLAWLYSQLNKVYDWFGASYYKLKEAAENAWNWAYSLASWAFTSAIEYALRLASDIIAAFLAWINWLRTHIEEVRNGLIEDILALYDWIEYKFRNIGSIVSQYVGNVLEQAKQIIYGIQNYLTTLISNSVNWLNSVISSAYGWLLLIKDKLLQLIATLTPDLLTLFVNFVSRWMNAIVNFFTNPLVFILDVIQPVFISFLCYVLAWSFGATKYELSKSPPWKKG